MIKKFRFITKQQAEFLEKIKEGKKTNAEIARARNVDTATTYQSLESLKKRGLIRIENKQKYRFNKKIIKLTELGWMYLEFYREYVQLTEKYPDFLK